MDQPGMVRVFVVEPETLVSVSKFCVYAVPSVVREIAGTSRVSSDSRRGMARRGRFPIGRVAGRANSERSQERLVMGFPRLGGRPAGLALAFLPSSRELPADGANFFPNTSGHVRGRGVRPP